MDIPHQNPDLPELDSLERSIYEWQMWIEDLGEFGQRKLKNSSVLITRCGGVGGLVAYQLAAAGVGRLVIAHAGDVKASDLHRQLLMTRDWIGKPRIESIQKRLLELNPDIAIQAVASNATEENARELVEQADVIVDCAPLFSERFALNRQSVSQSKPMVECAMYEMEGQLTTFFPGQTPCLQCLYPVAPPTWKRQFPVLGAISGTVGCLAATEAIKILTNLGKPLRNKMLRMDLREMTFRTVRLKRRKDCVVCSHLFA